MLPLFSINKTMSKNILKGVFLVGLGAASEKVVELIERQREPAEALA